MPPNYFAGQSPPPGTVRPTTAEPVGPVASTGQTAASAAGAVRPVPQTGQTDAMVLASASTPALAPILSSATTGQTNELEGFVPPYTTKSYGEPPFSPAMPQDVWDNLTRNSPHNAVQTMSDTAPAVNRLSSGAQTSNAESYKADLIKIKEDLSQLFRSELSQLGLAPSKSRLYQRPYPNAFDLVPYPSGWRVPDFIKFSGDDNRSTWEYVSQYVAQLGETSSSNSLRVHLFSLS